MSQLENDNQHQMYVAGDLCMQINTIFAGAAWGIPLPDCEAWKWTM